MLHITKQQQQPTKIHNSDCDANEELIKFDAVTWKKKFMKKLFGLNLISMARQKKSKKFFEINDEILFGWKCSKSLVEENILCDLTLLIFVSIGKDCDIVRGVEVG